MAALAVLPASGAASAVLRPLTAACRFEAPELTTDAAGVTRVTVPGCAQRVIPGEPVVPFRTLRLLLPPGLAATGVVARATPAAVTLPGAWQLETGRAPAANAAPLPGQSAAPVHAAPAPSPYPAALAELASVQRLAGHDLAVIRVFPLAYAPENRLLTFASGVTVELLLCPEPAQAFGTRAARIPPSPHAGERQRVAAAADNPEALAAYPAAAPEAALGASDHYLLVTRAALLPAFQPLLDQKAAAGLTVHTETMESITNSFAGVDAAERLRNYIRHAYTDWGVGYVLLGGDTKAVPYRGAYARCSGVVWNLMPSDLYFACLDGSWNRDGDGIWGEPDDGETGGEVDLLPEVCVGRAPVETAAEVTNFVARCLAAAQVPSAPFRALLGGEVLNAAGAQGGNALDTLLPALDSSHCPAAWLDDRPLTSAAWGVPEALAALNRSPLLVAHFGHGTDYGYSTMALRLTAEDLAALTNAEPFLLYSTACNTGAFDNNFGMADCIAEELVKRPAHGAFAVLANAREGWYDDAAEARYSGEYQERFFSRLLSGEQTPVGLAHQLARQDLLGHVESGGANMPYRWCTFGITLFGDPHLPVRVPLSLRFSASPARRVVTWNSWTNRTYAVYRTADLSVNPGACLASNVPATPPTNVYTDSAPDMVRAFYRVVAE